MLQQVVNGVVREKCKKKINLPHYFTLWNMVGPWRTIWFFKFRAEFQNAFDRFNRLGYGSTHA
jgi:hypothetical protein